MRSKCVYMYVTYNAGNDRRNGNGSRVNEFIHTACIMEMSESYKEISQGATRA